MNRSARRILLAVESAAESAHFSAHSAVLLAIEKSAAVNFSPTRMPVDPTPFRHLSGDHVLISSWMKEQPHGHTK
jgi:hypothetical protein